NAGDLDAQRVQRTDGGFATGAGTLYTYVERLDAIFHGLATSLLGSNLCCERRGLARALETGATSRRPRQGVALAVGNGDDSVVERCVDVRDAVRYALFDLLASARGAACGSFCHLLFLDYFFREAAARRGPLRVRALVRVRCPCTGRPRRWRMPR